MLAQVPKRHETILAGVDEANPRNGENTLLTYYVGRAGGPNLLELKLCIVPTVAWRQ